MGKRLKRLAPWLIELANPWLHARTLNETFGTTYRAEDIAEMEPERLDAGLATATYVIGEQTRALKKGKKG